MYALINCDIYTGKTVEYDKAIIVEGDKISAVIPSAELDSGIETIDLEGSCVAPGFIDIQVNGGGGVLFNDSPTVSGISKIVEAHRQFGTTGMLPTFITGSQSSMKQAVNAVNDYLNDAGAKGVLGIHLEGPFLEEGKAGVHDKSFIRSVNDEDLEIMNSLNVGVTLVTLAPDKVDLSIIENLSKAGIKVSIGHTDADHNQTLSAFEKGATCTTHLYNAMSPLNSRAPGVVGAALADASSWMGIIVDGFHADFLAVKVAINAKKKGKTLLVTDSMPPVGSENKEFKLGEYEIEVKDGRCVTSNGTLAGSALDMASAVRNCIQNIGIPMDEALRMASTYPAEFLEIERDYGYIAPGYIANLAIFNSQLIINSVIVEGEYISYG